MTASPGAGTGTGYPVHPEARSTAGDRAPVTPAAGALVSEAEIPLESGSVHWYPAAGLLHRGTVVLLPGRGEHPGVYERFGRRLAADGYVAHVLDLAPAAGPDEVAAAVDAVAPGAAAPLVLAGSDTGALHALAAAVRTAVPPHALLLAGVPGSGDRASGAEGWDGELDARTACPTHQGRLAEDPSFTPGALAVPVPDALAAAAEAVLSAPPAVPVLLVHGAADRVSSAAGARALAARLPASTLATVSDGRHDALNDIQHRSVAALVVQWLERLRAEGPPLLTVEGAGVL